MALHHVQHVLEVARQQPGFRRPWSRLEELLPAVDVDEMYFGGGYIASATIPGQNGSTWS